MDYTTKNATNNAKGIETSLNIPNLGYEVAPAGESDSVGGLPCAAAAVVLIVWPL
ncbi:hypothetical protein [Chromobacterium haemolyticum]|uniref:hypothetical protein n=1 Tax=Chromobacterium haemolyticum TaxID=394935 RepID=UPI00159326C5|nr:hypothetical protein [Chromobacterium haemolyticum]